MDSYLATLAQWVAGGGLLALVSLLTWWTTNRGTKNANKTDSLKAANDAWEAIGNDLREDVATLRTRVDEVSKANAKLTEENRVLRSVVEDLMRWLSELEQWELRGSKPPPPYTIAQLIARMRVILGESK